jgi:target of rapamycin complex subunit LST8
MINCAVLHPNGAEIIFGDQNGEIKIWDLELQKARSFWQLDIPNISITSLEIAKDASMLIMGNSAGLFCCWESENQKDGGYGTTEDFVPIQECEAHDQYILKCKLSQNKKFLATCSSDRSCKIWVYNKEEEAF